MPLFNPVGWMISGKRSQSQVKSTGLTEEDIKKGRSGIVADIEGGFSKKKLNLSFLIKSLADTNPDHLKNFGLYFKVNVDEKQGDDNGGWTSYIDTGKKLNLSTSYYSFTLKKNDFTGLVLDYVYRCTKCCIVLRSESYYLCHSNDDPDFKLSIK